MERCFFLSVTILLTSCIAKPAIEIQESKVIGYHFDLEDKKTLKQPYVARFKKGKKELLYVLAKHVSDKDYPQIVNHPTNITIRRLFAKYKPQAVIVEGIPDPSDFSQDKIRTHLEKCRNRAFKGCGESFYAMDQALKNQARFITGEPTEKQVLDFVYESGFSQQDILGLYMVRQIPQMKRRGEFNEQTFPQDCQRFLDHYRERIGMTSRFDYLNFKAWYENHMREPKSFLNIENNDTAPHGGEDATYVQRISHLVGLARDRVIVKRIEQMLNLHDRVLIVYGGSHYLLQESALRDALGDPVYWKEVNEPAPSSF